MCSDPLSCHSALSCFRDSQAVSTASLTHVSLPQALCTGGFFFLKYYPPLPPAPSGHLYDWFLYFIWVSLEMPLCQTGLI